MNAIKERFKKTAAIFLSFCLLGIGTAVAQTPTFSDLNTDAFLKEAAETLRDYKILEGYPDGTFHPEGEITRAEMAAVVVRMLGMSQAAESAGTVFSKYSDVPQKHWANGYIILASAQEILHGNPDGSFSPDGKVTYEQAVKMLICALGYGQKFNDIPDAYPVSYLAQANEAGITRNTSGATDLPITRGTAAKLAYNALSAPMLVMTTIGLPSGGTFAVMNGENGNRLQTLENSRLSACKFYLLGKYNHVLLSAADLQSAEAEPVMGSTNIRLKCTEMGTEKLKRISANMLQETGNKVMKGLWNGQFNGEAAVEEIFSSGEIVLKGGFSESQAKEMVQAINDEIRILNEME